MRGTDGRPLGAVVWFTGYSGAGKSTLAANIAGLLRGRGLPVHEFDFTGSSQGEDGDRAYSPMLHRRLIRITGSVCGLLADGGHVAIASFISPCAEDRAHARSATPAGRFFEVHVATSLPVCESRDERGVYRLARRGLFSLPGISEMYEEPVAPEIRIDTEGRAATECARELLEVLARAGL